MSAVQEHPQCLFLPYFNGPGYDLDPIRVVLYDYGGGRGAMLVVECFGDAYSHYWGAMGDHRNIRRFVCECGEDYLVNKLMPGYLYGTRLEKKREVHLRRIVKRVRDALMAEAAA